MISNLNLINEKKRDKIKKGVDYITLNNKGSHLIDKVIIYGSSITDNCRDNSDIDVCIKTAENVNCCSELTILLGNFEVATDDCCDIHIYGHLKGKIKDEIDNKGVTVYEYTEN